MERKKWKIEKNIEDETCSACLSMPFPFILQTNKHKILEKKRKENRNETLLTPLKV